MSDDLSEEGVSWRREPNGAIPHFKVCRRCRVFVCFSWPDYGLLLARHQACGRMLDVLQGYVPPPGFAPDLSPMELLAMTSLETP